MIRRTNKSRAEYYNHFTDKKWGLSRNYDLSVNSSALTIDGTVNLIVDYINLKGKYKDSV